MANMKVQYWPSVGRRSSDVGQCRPRDSFLLEYRWLNVQKKWSQNINVKLAFQASIRSAPPRILAQSRKTGGRWIDTGSTRECSRSIGKTYRGNWQTFDRKRDLCASWNSFCARRSVRLGTSERNATRPGLIIQIRWCENPGLSSSRHSKFGQWDFHTPRPTRHRARISAHMRVLCNGMMTL